MQTLKQAPRTRPQDIAIETLDAEALDSLALADDDESAFAEIEAAMEIEALRAEQEAEMLAEGRQADGREIAFDEVDLDGGRAADIEDERRMELHLHGYGDDQIDDFDF